MQCSHRFVLALFALCVSTTTAWPQVPHTISYQGVIDDGSGKHPPIVTTVIVRLFENESNGQPIHTEAFGGSTLKYDPFYGTFNVILGQGTLQNGKQLFELSFDKPYWLSVEVDGKESTSRTQLTAAPYALNVANGVPIGTIVAYYGVIDNQTYPAPAGWLLCDGSAFAADSFPILDHLLGNTHQTPDLRGTFLRGANKNKEGVSRSDSLKDPDEDTQRTGGLAGPQKIGSVQRNAFKTHSHKALNLVDANTTKGDRTVWLIGPTPQTNIPDYAKTDDAGGSTETRPNNVYINWIIKAK